MMAGRWLLLLLTLICGSAFAQRTQTVGDYTVYSSALPSGFLTPEVARQYGILRSRTQGVLLVSVKYRGESSTARVEAQVAPGGERMQPLPLRSVRTDGTVSYIGTFPIADGESRQFLVRVIPPNAEPITLSFSQEFFEDE